MPFCKGLKIRILIVTPAKQCSLSGNRVTAGRWRKILSSLGHDVNVADRYHSGEFDLLIALHARKSHHSVIQFYKYCYGKPVIVAMTGTDLHCDLGRSHEVEESLKLADRVLLLEPNAGRKLAKNLQDKVRVIFQSASIVNPKPKALTRWFEVTVIGHLRSVKDPFRTAYSASGLPANSRIRIVQIGRALNSTMEKTAISITLKNSRYRFLGPMSYSETQRRLARSSLTVLSSKSEGGPAVLSEAIVNSVPVLASRIDATEGLLGAMYQGLFNVGDTSRLTDLLYRAEKDASFRQQLVRSTESIRQKFQPEFEIKSWQKLIAELKGR